MAGQQPGAAAGSPSVPGGPWTAGTPPRGRSRHAQAGHRSPSCCSGNTRGPEGPDAPRPGASGGKQRPPALLDRKEGELLKAGLLSLSVSLPSLGTPVLSPKGQAAQKGQLVHQTHDLGLGTRGGALEMF